MLSRIGFVQRGIFHSEYPLARSARRRAVGGDCVVECAVFAGSAGDTPQRRAEISIRKWLPVGRRARRMDRRNVRHRGDRRPCESPQPPTQCVSPQLPRDAHSPRQPPSAPALPAVGDEPGFTALLPAAAAIGPPCRSSTATKCGRVSNTTSASHLILPSVVSKKGLRLAHKDASC